MLIERARPKPSSTQTIHQPVFLIQTAPSAKAKTSTAQKQRRQGQRQQLGPYHSHHCCHLKIHKRSSPPFHKRRKEDQHKALADNSKATTITTPAVTNAVHSTQPKKAALTSSGRPKQADPVDNTAGQKAVMLLIRLRPHTARSKAGKPQELGKAAVSLCPHWTSPTVSPDEPVVSRHVFGKHGGVT